MNPKDRYTAEQALNHEWIKNKALHRFGREMFFSARDDDPPVIQTCTKTVALKLTKHSVSMFPMSIVDLSIHEMPDRSCLVSSAHKAIGF